MTLQHGDQDPSSSIKEHERTVERRWIVKLWMCMNALRSLFWRGISHLTKDNACHCKQDRRVVKTVVAVVFSPVDLVLDLVETVELALPSLT